MYRLALRVLAAVPNDHLEVSFGTELLTIEKGEDLHVLIQRLGVAPATLYGMSSGARSNMVLASRYPEDVAVFVIAPHLQPVLDVLLPFVKKHTPALGTAAGSHP